MTTQILQILNLPDYSQQIARAAEALSVGKLVLVPTETVYGVAGLLANGDSRQALREIRQGKGTKPLIPHLARRNDAGRFLPKVGDFAQRMMRKLWPGPVGLIFDVPQDQQAKIARELGAEQNELFEGFTITLRCPDHPVFFDLVSQIPGPVALTALPASSHRLDDISNDVLNRVEMVFDAGPTRFAKPSTLLKVNETGYEIVRPGVYDQRIIDRMLKTSVLFVCSGNTCRSPMAEALAQQYFAEKLKLSPRELESKGIVIQSAGVAAMPGGRANPLAVEVLREMGADLSGHHSQPLSVELIHQADVIYTMTHGHLQAVAAMAPQAMDKAFSLGGNEDIEDPIGGDKTLYAKTAQQIKELLHQRLPRDVAV